MINYKIQGEWKIQLTMIINNDNDIIVMKFVTCIQRAIIWKL